MEFPASTPEGKQAGGSRRSKQDKSQGRVTALRCLARQHGLGRRLWCQGFVPRQHDFGMPPRVCPWHLPDPPSSELYPGLRQEMRQNQHGHDQQAINKTNTPLTRLTAAHSHIPHRPLC
ncbi:hypothetical protein AAFF_G00436520 [Aldrovandia affinis]|uniref:Uncharacterized protein n=1 Tax=Aldrovandia affinis TaxID=143900 RepID=A0AAD7S8C1_9TELE|nr:hypothetical protein AAFF_G00436520 [Aldrovandia affinis]